MTRAHYFIIPRTSRRKAHKWRRDPEHRRFSCESKVRHASYAAALAHARRVNRSGTLFPGKPLLQPYECWYCDGWHIGHGPKQRRFEPSRLVEAVVPELGDRAGHCLVAENTGRARKRRMAIEKRAAAALKRIARPNSQRVMAVVPRVVTNSREGR